MSSTSSSLADLCFAVCSELSAGPGTFFEAGAHDGITQSNTQLLQSELGWSGILVEPSRQFHFLCKNRPDNTLINAALTETVQDSVRGLFHGNLGDTGARDLVSFYRQAGRTGSLRLRVRAIRNEVLRWLGVRRGRSHKDLVTVQALTLDQVVDRAGVQVIDFLSLDLEGMELPVLRGFSWTVRPRVMVVETRLTDHMEMTHLLHSNGYVLAGVFPERVRTQGVDARVVHSNGFWVDRSESGLWDLVSGQLAQEDADG